MLLLMLLRLPRLHAPMDRGDLDCRFFDIAWCTWRWFFSLSRVEHCINYARLATRYNVGECSLFCSASYGLALSTAIPGREEKRRKTKFFTWKNIQKEIMSRLFVYLKCLSCKHGRRGNKPELVYLNLSETVVGVKSCWRLPFTSWKWVNKLRRRWPSTSKLTWDNTENELKNWDGGDQAPVSLRGRTRVISYLLNTSPQRSRDDRDMCRFLDGSLRHCRNHNAVCSHSTETSNHGDTCCCRCLL